MFHLTGEKFKNLRFQIGTSSWGGRRYFSHVFTQEGVAMLSSVLTLGEQCRLISLLCGRL